ncbi:ABC transporter substrate-binding protein [Sporosarcina sp. FSL K6-3457]|uniref:ABC transporter substrate-binding protein n=1 Tax=Sporosarcina sp. FSL K6-3457 TaxID=2978204 RepID=UPI0030FC9A1E
MVNNTGISRLGNSISIFSILAIIMFALSGCGEQTNNTNKADNAKDTIAVSDAVEAEEEEEVREVQHAMGVTKIKGTPQRVVILTNEGTEALLALGIKPVGAVRSWTGEPWYEHINEEMAGVQELGFENEPNFEAILELDPDIIIGNKVRHEEAYDQLSKIAPTVFSEDLSGQWKINFELYANTLNKKAEGETVMKAFDDRVAQAKEALGDKKEMKVSVVRFSAKDVRIYQKDTFSGVLLEQMGVGRPESQDVDNFMETVSEEAMETMDGDIMFYWVTEADVYEKAKQWLENPVFKSLNVSKENQVFEVNETIWNTAGGIKAANLLLDDLVERLK